MQRRTGQRDAIRTVLNDAHGPLSAQEVLDHAQGEVPGLGIATVYRNLKALVEEGWLAQVDLPGEPGRFERAGKEHHHHFECRACKRVFDIPGCAEVHAPGLPSGFVVDDHEVLLFGFCQECTAASPGAGQ